MLDKTHLPRRHGRTRHRRQHHHERWRGGSRRLHRVGGLRRDGRAAYAARLHQSQQPQQRGFSRQRQTLRQRAERGTADARGALRHQHAADGGTLRRRAMGYPRDRRTGPAWRARLAGLRDRIGDRSRHAYGVLLRGESRAYACRRRCADLLRPPVSPGRRALGACHACGRSRRACRRIGRAENVRFGEVVAPARQAS